VDSSPRLRPSSASRGWRWVFLINIPVGIFALIAVTATLHLHHIKRQAVIDWLGAATLVIGVVPLLLVAEQGRTWGWTSTNSILAYVIGVVGSRSFHLGRAWRG